MGCCGKARTAAAAPPREDARPLAAPAARGAQYFEYVGRTALSAYGPVSGRHYRFGYPGARVAIDDRDAGAMQGVPHLRQAVGDDSR